MKRAPSAISPLLALDRRSRRPLHRQLYDGYRDAIVDGRLGAGQRMPSTRALADELGVSRLPVVQAFEQLQAEGYLEGRVGAGTFVARGLSAEHPAPRGAEPPPGRRDVAADVAPAEPEPWTGGLGPFRVSQPAVEELPLAAWSRLVLRHARDAPRRQLLYGDAMGYLPFREAVAAYLRSARGVRCEAEQVLVVSGSQQALTLCARVLLDLRSPVWVEEPGYPGARNVLALARARLVPVPVDDEGLDVAAGIARAPRARAAYVTPSHQYPLGVTMTAARRLQLLDWAQRAGAWIIEDDYDSEYRYDARPIAALQGLDRDARVLYIGTFSKVLFPSLRVGYLVVPADLAPRFARVRDANDIFPSTLYQAVLADFLVEGHFARHLRRTRGLYRDRRAALVAGLSSLRGVAILGDPAGMHLTATWPRLRDLDLARRAAAQRLWALPLSSCHLATPARQGVVLGFACAPAAELAAAARQLAQVAGA